MDFSVLLSVYHNDNPTDFLEAVRSISINQTLPPSEIILVVDGPVENNLSEAINILELEIPYLKTIRLKENVGLGKALNIGLQSVSNELVARMDSDDISICERFEKQIDYMKNHPNCDVLGGQITEFIGEDHCKVGKRSVPISDGNIKTWIKKRCPFNHMSVMFRKSSVMRAGNYLDWHFNEDYYLWIRMTQIGCNFANLSDTLVNVRVGKNMYARRGGWKYFKSEKELQNYMLRQGIISVIQYLYNVGIRFLVQIAMPNSVRAFVFRKLFRKK